MKDHYISHTVLFAIAAAMLVSCDEKGTAPQPNQVAAPQPNQVAAPQPNQVADPQPNKGTDPQPNKGTDPQLNKAREAAFTFLEKHAINIGAEWYTKQLVPPWDFSYINWKDLSLTDERVGAVTPPDKLNGVEYIAFFKFSSTAVRKSFGNEKGNPIKWENPWEASRGFTLEARLESGSWQIKPKGEGYLEIPSDRPEASEIR